MKADRVDRSINWSYRRFLRFINRIQTKRRDPYDGFKRYPVRRS